MYLLPVLLLLVYSSIHLISRTECNSHRDRYDDTKKYLKRNQVFAATYSDRNGSQQLCGYSTLDYYLYTGSKRHTKRERMQEEGLDALLLNIPVAKTIHVSTYFQYITCIQQSYIIYTYIKASKEPDKKMMDILINRVNAKEHREE
ncbi:uncharacterized protein BX663DRAFT_482856 [Cokeromyces recurvatus]|uniref:uncharacterized protein n=1 Tax=Cokeromyces recurvatus TaxID=90255 RepID=UPI00221FDDD1|nr:uncharacterized protein BX663DRAFT_482856 [Cokeromyces recurvatus]KAI7907204.1 hypothetical protein BX663DRAFT_482856 [Cokeromyces recurvatus]